MDLEIKLSAANLSSLSINIKDNSENLQLGVDESYTLTVDATPSASLQSNTIWGALRGLETFSQLVQWSSDPQTQENIYSIPVSPIQITDSPRFQWRGVLLDSSRHYLSVATIMRQLDAMSYNKFNILHWHFVDDESW